MTRDAIRDALRARIRDILERNAKIEGDLRREQNPLGGDWDENAILLENDQVVEACPPHRPGPADPRKPLP